MKRVIAIVGVVFALGVGYRVYQTASLLLTVTDPDFDIRDLAPAGGDDSLFHDQMLFDAVASEMPLSQFLQENPDAAEESVETPTGQRWFRLHSFLMYKFTDEKLTEFRFQFGQKDERIDAEFAWYTAKFGEPDEPPSVLPKPPVSEWETVRLGTWHPADKVKASLIVYETNNIGKILRLQVQADADSRTPRSLDPTTSEAGPNVKSDTARAGDTEGKILSESKLP